MACGRVGFDSSLLEEAEDGGGVRDGSGTTGSAEGTGGADSIGEGGSGTGGSTTSSGGTSSSGGTTTGGTTATGGMAATGGFVGTGGHFSVDDVIYYRGFETESGDDRSTSNGGDLAIQSDTAFRGLKALKAWQSGTDSQAYITVSFDEALFNRELHFRAWVYVPQTVTVHGANLVGFHSSEELGIDVNALTDNVVEIYEQPSGTAQSSSAGELPQGKWFCLQIGNYFHDTEGWVDVAIDGTSVVEIANTDTLPAEGISEVVYGMPWVGSSQENFVVYFDDVVIHSMPIPCR